MPVEFKCKVNGKDYFFVADENGEVRPHTDLKGPALIDAESVLPIAKKHFDEIRQSAIEAIAKPAPSKKESKNYKAFQTAEKSLLNAKILKTSLLKDIEKSLQSGFLALTCTVSTSKGPVEARDDISFDNKALQENSTKLSALSEKIETLSNDRKKSIEKKMNPVAKFFHKLRQFFNGGGWRTLAERADALKVKIDQKLTLNSAYLKANAEEKLFKDTEALSKEPIEKTDGKYDHLVLAQLNGLPESGFKLFVKRLMDKPTFSFFNIYPHLTEEKRTLFDEELLSRPDWASFADYHLFNEGKPVEHFNFDTFYKKFSDEHVRLLARAKHFQISKMTREAVRDTYIIIHASTNQLKSFEEWYSKNDRIPKNYLNSFLKYMICQKITKEASEPTEVLSLLKELMDLPTRQKAGVDDMETFFDQDWKQSYNQALSKAAIQDTLNKDTLSDEVVKKLEANIKCESFHLFTEA